MKLPETYYETTTPIQEYVEGIGLCWSFQVKKTVEYQMWEKDRDASSCTNNDPQTESR